MNWLRFLGKAPPLPPPPLVAPKQEPSSFATRVGAVEKTLWVWRQESRTFVLVDGQEFELVDPFLWNDFESLKDRVKRLEVSKDSLEKARDYLLQAIRLSR